MIVHEHEVYEIRAISDMGGHSKVIGYFKNEPDAAEVGKGQGGYGSNATPKLINLRVVIYESLDEYNEDHDQAKLKSIANKLSAEELELLRRKGIPVTK